MKHPEAKPIECSAHLCQATRPRLHTDDYARAAGWHIWRSINKNGDVCTETALCPEHAGNKPRTKPEPLAGEQTLW